MVNTDIYKGKRVFITGHTGFKGSWMCLMLKKLGAEVYGYSLEPPTNPSLYYSAEINKIVKSYISDIRKYNPLLKALTEVKPDFVFHMATQTFVRESHKDPLSTYAINVMGTANLLEAVRHVNSVRAVVNVTAGICYENKEWHWGYRENESMGGYDPYSNSKSCSELISSSYRNSYFNINEYGKTHQTALASARTSKVIGGGDWADDRLIPDFTRALSSDKVLKIRSPHTIKPCLHVLEPLTGYLQLGAALYNKGPRFAEGWNFGPDENDAKSVEWIVNKLCKLWGENVLYEIDSKPQPHDTTFLKLDCSKAKVELEWNQKWNIEAALENTVIWTKAFNQGKDARAICEHQIDMYNNI